MLYVLIAAFAIILAWVVFGMYEPPVPTHDPIVRDPIEVLNQRFLTGEITEKEYERVKDGLG